MVMGEITNKVYLGDEYTIYGWSKQEKEGIEAKYLLLPDGKTFLPSACYIGRNGVSLQATSPF